MIIPNNIIFKSEEKLKILSRSDFFTFATNCLNDYKQDKEPALERVWVMAVMSKSGWEFMEALGSVCVSRERWDIIKDAVQSYDEEHDGIYPTPSNNEWEEIKETINGQ
jgi:hypothetical protein